MSMHFRDIAAQVAADRAISGDEILALRRSSWDNGTISIEEADAIFAINDSIEKPTTEWRDYFVEAISEFLINGVSPRGFVDEAQAEWLIARIDHDGRLDSLTELELLVRIFERAESVPASLRTYALDQIQMAMLSGEGPTRRGGSLEKGNVTAAEAALMRRILFARSSERPAAISRAEAELLFRIKDETLGADNAPEWKRLFVQGVGNYLMGFSGHEPLSAERASELEAFMSDRRVSLGRFAGRMARADVGEGFRSVFGRGDPQPDREAEASAAQQIDGSKRLWLDTRINADDRIDEYEQALLEFLAEEQGLA